MANSSLLRLGVLTLVVVVSLSLADDSPATDGAVPAQTRGAADPATPQTRFLPGIGNVFNNIFNSCSRCRPSDQQFALRCCQSGERHCCFEGGFGGGFGNGFGGGFGFNSPGFAQPGFGGGFGGQPGFGGGFGGQPGFGGNFGGGFAQPGFQGQFGQPGFGFGTNVKAGFCPKQGIFGPKTRSGVDANPGLRSAVPAGDDAASGAGGADAQLARSERRARQATVDSPAADDGAAGDNNPSTRFLPNPFGPGSLIPNPFCRDECFNDFDCPGSLKCCLRDCRKCQNPSFF